MTAQLKVGTSLFRAVEMIGLVVEDNRKSLPLPPPVEGVLRYQFLKGFAAHVGTVVAPYDDQAGVDDGGLVDKQADAGITVELLRLRRTGKILMVA